MGEEVEEAIEKYKWLVPLVYDIETMSLVEARPQDMCSAVYLKLEADKVIADKDKVIAELKQQLRKQKIKHAGLMVRECSRKFYIVSSPKEETFWFKWIKRWINIENILKEKELWL